MEKKFSELIAQVKEKGYGSIIKETMASMQNLTRTLSLMRDEYGEDERASKEIGNFEAVAMAFVMALMLFEKEVKGFTEED